MPTALVTGVTGQDGSYMAELLLEKGYRVVGSVRTENSPALRIAAIRDRIELVTADLLDESSLRKVIDRYRPDEIYNFAARASSSHLFESPVLTAEHNAVAVLRILEAIRTTHSTARFCQASSSEMFGNAQAFPQNELTQFRPRNPYGVAKLFAHGMVGTYRETHGIFACSSILFNHESPRRGEEFVTRKIAMAVARISAGLADSLPLGSLDSTRDWGFSGDYVRAMWQMLQATSAGDYVVATGQSHSVRDFCRIAFTHVGLDYEKFVVLNQDAWRRPESVPLVGDATKARTLLGWQPAVSFEGLVHMMVEADVQRLSSAV